MQISHHATSNNDCFCSSTYKFIARIYSIVFIRFPLKLFDFSYNPLLYENIKHLIKLPHEYLLESFTDRDLKTYEQGITFNNTTGPMHEVLSENVKFNNCLLNVISSFSLNPSIYENRLPVKTMFSKQ
jgi:hypothetical protein